MCGLENIPMMTERKETSGSNREGRECKITIYKRGRICIMKN